MDAGGIGFLLWESMRSFSPWEACTVLIVMVAVIDTISARVRRRIL